MTALPMLTACANAQWRGLTDEERAALRNDHRIPYLRLLEVPIPHAPIWTVEHPVAGSMTLIGVKVDG